MIWSRQCIVLLVAFLGASLNAGAAIYAVTNTLTNGPGSLLQALTDAAANPGVDDITISNVSGTITLSAPVPPVGDVRIFGPGAQSLSIVSPGLGIASSQATTISGLKLVSLGADSSILLNSGTLTLINCEVSGGSVSHRGAAIASSGVLRMLGCLIANNTSQGGFVIYYPNPTPHYWAGQGGGLDLSGAAYITNCTFSGNGARTMMQFSGQGGAIYVEAGDLFLVNCTLDQNSAAQGGDIFVQTGNVRVINCLLTRDTLGTLSVSQGNLFTNASAAGLGPLHYNGGDTMTEALLANSPAINRGLNLGAPTVDQRGISRPQGSRVDIGAFEFEKPAGYVEIAIDAQGLGSVSAVPAEPFVPSSTVATISAEPGEDFALAQWVGDATGRQNPLTILANRDLSVTAVFQYAPMTVTNSPGSTSYVSNLKAWGPGSFRQAIRDLNASGGGKIRFSSVTGTISPSLGLPALQANFAIYGPGISNLQITFPDGADSFFINAGATGLISGLSVQSPSRTALENYGGLQLHNMCFQNCRDQNGGAILNAGHMTVSGSRFEYNTAGRGGGIYTSGTLWLTGCDFISNSVYAAPGELDKGGGALYQTNGTTEVSGCAFFGNHAQGSGVAGNLNAGSGQGGALFISGGALNIQSSLVESNFTEGPGALNDLPGYFSGNAGSALGSGIWVHEAILGITNCAFIGNRGVAGISPGATRFPGGGGIAAGAGVYADTATVLLCNSTFARNELKSGSTGGSPLAPGGGIDGLGAAIAIYHGTGIVQNCTVSENAAFGGDSYSYPFGRGPGHGLGAGLWTDSTNVVSVNTIFFGNLGATNGSSGLLPNDYYGPGSSSGHNLFGVVMGLTNLLASDRNGIDPRLGPLQDNGGTTPSYALLAGSPAIDAGAPTDCHLDQRGQPRTIDDPSVPNWMNSDGTDIGALEVNPVLTLTGIFTQETNTTLQFTTVSNGRYGLQWKPDLLAPTWISLPDDIPGSGGIVSFTNLSAASFPSRFYRAWQR